MNQEDEEISEENEPEYSPEEEKTIWSLLMRDPGALTVLELETCRRYLESDQGWEKFDSSRNWDYCMDQILRELPTRGAVKVMINDYLVWSEPTTTVQRLLTAARLWPRQDLLVRYTHDGFALIFPTDDEQIRLTDGENLYSYSREEQAQDLRIQEEVDQCVREEQAREAERFLGAYI